MGTPRDALHEATGRCSLCPLRGNPIVPADGPPEPLLVVVGEAPGEKEVEIGKPFVGPAGENLRAALDLVDIDVGSVHFTNATLCYPGRDVTAGEYNHPSTEAVKACRPRLLREIRATFATKVLAAGGYAGRSLTGRKVVIETSRCVVAGPVQRHLLGNGVDVGLTYHPKARRGNPIADVAADLRCLFGRPVGTSGHPAADTAIAMPEEIQLQPRLSVDGLELSVESPSQSIQIRTLEALERFVDDRISSLTPSQFRLIGSLAAILASLSLPPHARQSDAIMKSLDAYHFAADDREQSQAFDDGVRESAARLSRSDVSDAVIVELLGLQ